MEMYAIHASHKEKWICSIPAPYISEKLNEKNIFPLANLIYFFIFSIIALSPLFSLYFFPSM